MKKKELKKQIESLLRDNDCFRGLHNQFVKRLDDLDEENHQKIIRIEKEITKIKNLLKLEGVTDLTAKIAENMSKLYNIGKIEKDFKPETENLNEDEKVINKK